MSFAVKWDNEDRTVIRSEIVGDWTWDDFVAQIMGMYAMMYTVDHTVDIIADGLAGHALPPGDMMIRLRSVRGERPPNMGRMVLVDAHPFERAIWGIMSWVYPHTPPLGFVDSLEEAYHLLEDRVAVY